MKKTVKVVYEEDIIPTIFETRSSKRLITKERENSEVCSFHIVTSTILGASPYEVVYPDNDEILYILEGKGTLIANDQGYDMRPGTAIYIPKGCGYRMIRETPLKIACVIAPPRLRSDWAAKRDPSHKVLVLLEPEDAVRKK